MRIEAQDEKLIDQEGLLMLRPVGEFGGQSFYF
jgi:hypothetical protein